jgi:hypothetical protein
VAQTDFTIADVLVWARTKPADEAYNYVDARDCALCQFLRETGRVASPSVNAWDFGSTEGGPRLPIDERSMPPFSTRTTATCKTGLSAGWSIVSKSLP